ncbi:uncharacterized protein LOC126708524 [Quercus robur]|uniref:uncharacterized protein LOC126708524 n=1 Tax=Quercus robur TaxID=38942 RepID=UPI0021614678|nr:uncharacterized protein LOC126708524 [Quercus robur]
MAARGRFSRGFGGAWWRVEARGKASGDRISGFWSREILEHVCGVGFIRRSLKLHRSEIDVTGLLEFVDLGHSTAPRWLRDAVESRSSREAYVTSDGDVNPTLYNDTHTRLYTFTKTAKSSCFNTLCNSIIPVRTDIPLAIPLESISTPEQQFDLQLMLFWDSSNGNWFLKFGQDETVIGFWPKNVFTALGDGANYVEWGGEVFSPPGVPSPPMGSGYSERLKENTKYDAYCRQIKTINETDYVLNAVDTESFSDIVQYQVIDEGRVGADQHLVLFGGVGGYIGE